MYARDDELELQNKLSAERNSAFKIERAPLEKRNYAKLPVFSILDEVYAIVHDNFSPALKLMVPWVGVFWLLVCGVGLAVFGDLLGLLRFAQALKTGEGMLELLVFGGLLAGSVGFVFSNIAIRWHRLLLLDEKHNTSHPFRLEPQSFKYFLLAAVLWIASMVLNLFAESMTPVIRGNMFLSTAVLVGVLSATVLLTRLAIKLPAIAVDHDSLSMSDVMTRTKGNFWRLLGLIVVFGITISVIMWLAKLVAVAIGVIHTLGLALAVFICALAAAICWLLSVTILTVLYRYFFGMPAKPSNS